MGNVINFKNNDDEFSEVKSIDEYDDEIDNKNMLIVGTSGKGQSQHYDKNGNRL